MLFLQLIVSGILAGLVVAVTAMGFTWIRRVTGIFHLAHAAVFLVAAYVIDAGTRLGIPLPLTVVGAAVAAALLGLAIDSLIYRPLVRRRAMPVVVVVASFVVLILVQNVVLLVAGGQPRRLDLDIALYPWKVGGLTINLLELVGAGISILLLIVLVLVLRIPAVGLPVRAVMLDAARAELVGTNVAKVRAIVVAIASAVLAIPALVMLGTTGISVGSGLPLLLVAMTAAIVGNPDTLFGAYVGSIVVLVVQFGSSFWIPASWQSTVVFTLLIVALALRPASLSRTLTARSV